MVVKINDIITSTTGLSPEVLTIFLGITLLLFYDNLYILKNIMLTTFVLAIFDLYLKKFLLLQANNDYHIFIINNVITIVTIDILVKSVHDKNHEKLTFINYLNIAFACLFYETIVFKLYNYNNLSNKRLRSVTKTIIRLSTINILATFLSDQKFDQEWFNFALSQIFSFSLFNTIFEE
jgi:hypothetical protein